ncbi:MAG: FHA domain-containing protein [Thermoanaerobaculia bacterium]
MELIVRHLSGSRAGQEQRFDRDVIGLGRNPVNDIAFDPDQDRMVSGKHAELALQNGAWILRDLNSSNGTIVDGERITERPLRPGDIIQLGKNGPRLEIRFVPLMQEVEPTVVVPLESAGGGPSLVEGRTVMMSMQDATASPGVAAAPGVVAAPSSRKKSPVLKILAAVAALFLLLVVGLVGAAVMMRRSNAAKRATAEAAQKQKAIDEAETLRRRIEAQKAQVAQTAASLEQMQTTTTGTVAGGDAQMTDMQRQLAESQRLIEELTRELQVKNDAIASAKSHPAPAPAPVRRPTTSPTVRQVTSTPAVTSPSTPSPSSGGQTASTTPGATTAGTSTSVVSSTPSATQTPLFTGKQLKKKVYVNALAPEIPPAGLPQGMARDLANSFGAALVSTGDYVLGQKGLASVSVTVTNYKADQKTSVDVKKTADSARRIGGLFGAKVPSSPADVKSYSYDSAMGARVRVYDPQGSEIASAEPYAESADRKSKFSVANVPFNQLVLSDTPTGDVARKVIGDAVEGLLQSFEGLEWFGVVSSHKKDKVTLGIGRAANVDVGDVFEIYDGSHSLARARVTSITENSAEAELLAPTKEKLSNKRVRYLGNERGGPKPDSAKTLTIRSKTSAMAGPGNSFQAVKELKPGTTLRFHFSVGTWARAQDNSGSFWVPLVAAKIGS